MAEKRKREAMMIEVRLKQRAQNEIAMTNTEEYNFEPSPKLRELRPHYQFMDTELSGSKPGRVIDSNKMRFQQLQTLGPQPLSQNRSGEFLPSNDSSKKFLHKNSSNPWQTLLNDQSMGSPAQSPPKTTKKKALKGMSSIDSESGPNSKTPKISHRSVFMPENLQTDEGRGSSVFKTSAA
mmetsp:Transcript_13287/g.20776  ORF Transcript_13287/g.20776 Transcript_13287/m.20776 type:complete len:180 (+) Transcript_13287:540-1079(+)